MCSSPANFGSLSTCCKFEICVFNSPSAVESAWRGKEKAVVSTKTNTPKAAVNLLFIVLPVYLKSSTRIFHDATPRTTPGGTPCWSPLTSQGSNDQTEAVMLSGPRPTAQYLIGPEL